jgi:hypothetical protein
VPRAVMVPEETLEKLVLVAQHVAKGPARAFNQGESYPDAEARGALGELWYCGLLGEEELKARYELD